MTPLLAFAQTSSYELTPPTHRMPPILWTAFTAVNKVHSTWRWYRRYDLYTQPNTLSQLLAGHLINYAAGDMLLLRIAAQCLLISTRVLDCARQQTKLYEAAQRWVWAVKGYYPQPNGEKWEFSSSSQWLSIQCQAIYKHIERVIESTMRVFVECFKLSMCLMDAIDVFCLSPYTSHEGINELFVNATKWMDNIVENNEELLQGVETNKPLIEKILYNSPITYGQLHNTVTQAIEKTETVYEKVKTISRIGDGIIMEFGSRVVYGCSIILGRKLNNSA